MTRALVTFVRFSTSATDAPQSDVRTRPAHMLIGGVSATEVVAVSGTATGGEDRPVCPTGFTHALVKVTGGDVLATWGDDPTADATGFPILDGEKEALPVRPGELLSFIELAGE